MAIPKFSSAYLLSLLSLLLIHSSAAAWTSQKVKDSFTGSTSLVIQSTSRNTLILGFPYQGKNRGNLSIVVSEDGSPTVFFSIDKGQIVCPISYCAVAVKFGDKPPRNLVAHPSAMAGEYGTVRFSYPPAVIEELAGASDFTVRVEVFGNGFHDLRFTNSKPIDTSGIRLQY